MASTSYSSKLQRNRDETQMADSSAAPWPFFISKLPDSMIVEIFLKLPVATQMRCRQVCKSLRTILSSASFDQARPAKGPSELVILRSGKLFYFIEGGESIPAAVSSPETGPRCASRRSILHLVNSCKGLVCMILCRGSYITPTCSRAYGYCHGKTIFLVNPATSEYIALPSFLAQGNQNGILRSNPLH